MPGAQRAVDDAWCLQCGRQATVIGASMDPRHPLVDCAYPGANGKVFGHRRTVGTLDEAEAGAIVAASKAGKERQDHYAGRHTRPRPATCPVCVELAGAPTTRAHGYEPYPLKAPLCQHLRRQHGQDNMDLALRYTPLVDLTELHQALHSNAHPDSRGQL